MPPNPVIASADLIPAIGYIRVSMAREEMISPQIQRAAITEWARRMGRRIVDWVEDLDLTGRNFRRKVIRAIERIEAREAIEIVAFRYDRWGRNALESLANIVRVEQAGGQVHSATEPIDAETAIGKYNRHNALGLAEMQSNLIGEGWKGAHRNRIDRGLTNGGTPRFGYIRLGRVLDPYADSPHHRYRRDPEDPLGERYEPDYANGTADAHITMYDLYLDESQGFNKIGQWLNAREIRNARGRRWAEGTVRNVMDSGFAAGLLQIHDSERCRCGHSAKCRKMIRVPGAHHPIIDEETWERYLRKRAARATMPPRARTPTYPLTSLVHCGHCGTSMAGSNAGEHTGGYYRCGKWKRDRSCSPAFPSRVAVERAVLAELAAWAADIDSIAAQATVRREVRIPAEVDRARLVRALAENDTALQRLAVRAAMDTKMPAAAWDGARDELLTDRARIEKELEAHEPAETLIDPRQRLPIMVGVVEEWDVLPAGALREMLTEVIRHVRVFRVADAKPRTVEAARCLVTPVWEPCECRRCA